MWRYYFLQRSDNYCPNWQASVEAQERLNAIKKGVRPTTEEISLKSSSL